MSVISETVLSFAKEGQNETALRAAAYRASAFAACEIDLVDGRWVCKLQRNGRTPKSSDDLKSEFLCILNDENLREQIESRVAPIRNVIVALAFGALTRTQPVAS